MKNELHVVLTGRWYKEHLNGKREEYREITPYWVQRLCVPEVRTISQQTAKQIVSCILHKGILPVYTRFRNFETMVGHYGYTGRTFEKPVVGIRIGYGRPEWGAPKDRPMFIIEGGEVADVSK